MFTGLVECLGEVTAVREGAGSVRLVIRAAQVAQDAAIGDSICVSGCCLTVVEISQSDLHFDVVPETLRCTSFSRLRPGTLINLERSLRVGDRLGGHFVTGHVDAIGRLVKREDGADWSFFFFETPAALTRQMANKGSIAIDGVSLTLVNVTDTGFSVALIPHTLSVTTLGRLQAGEVVNIETDLLAKYVERQLAGGHQSAAAP